ncbi:MAG TPA: tetratricopeptide repeat protein [Chthonomonadales bacterium]|nr:tetratricopeptide repeat protein [Chthonomonadales bacterium]
MPFGNANPGRTAASSSHRGIRALRKADRLARLGHVDEAIDVVQEAMRNGADRYTCFLRLARLYRTQQQFTRALSAAETAIAEFPERISAREALIALHLEARDYASAAHASQELLRVAPRHLPARDALGAAYIGMGDVQAAVRVANDLIRLDPQDPAHRFKKALLCQHQGAVRLAVIEFQRVLQMAPEEDMADGAREQLEALDGFQIGQIVALCEVDAGFRVRLLQDLDQAVEERGFFLSDAGRRALSDWCCEALERAQHLAHLRVYH